jgi:hypothetical protein
MFTFLQKITSCNTTWYPLFSEISPSHKLLGSHAQVTIYIW